MKYLNIELPDDFLQGEERCGYYVSPEMKEVWAIELDLLSQFMILSCNKIISSLAKSHNLRYLDLFSKYEQEGKLPKEMTIDGIHLRPKYYFKWYDLLKS